MSLVTDERAQLSSALAALDSTLRAALLEAASKVAEQYCARKFAAETIEEDYDGDDSDELLLKRFPVNSMSSVKLISGADETDITDEVNFTSESGLLFIRPESDYTCFPLGRRNVRVSYNGGFETVPEDVQSAVISIAASLAVSESVGRELSSEKLGDWSASYVAEQGNLPSQARMLLSSYRDRP